MKISILGTGRVGTALGKKLAACGYPIVMGSRTPDSEHLRQMIAESQGELSAAAVSAAVESAEMVILAVPWQSAEATLRSAGSLQGKILVDCINPLNDQFNGLDLGFTTSASERIAEWVPEARVVKAFNTVSSATMADPTYGSHPATMF